MTFTEQLAKNFKKFQAADDFDIIVLQTQQNHAIYGNAKRRKELKMQTRATKMVKGL